MISDQEKIEAIVAFGKTKFQMKLAIAFVLALVLTFTIFLYVKEYPKEYNFLIIAFIIVLNYGITFAIWTCPYCNKVLWSVKFNIDYCPNCNEPLTQKGLSIKHNNSTYISRGNSCYSESFDNSNKRKYTKNNSTGIASVEKGYQYKEKSLSKSEIENKEIARLLGLGSFVLILIVLIIAIISKYASIDPSFTVISLGFLAIAFLAIFISTFFTDETRTLWGTNVSLKENYNSFRFNQVFLFLFSLAFILGFVTEL